MDMEQIVEVNDILGVSELKSKLGTVWYCNSSSWRGKILFQWGVIAALYGLMGSGEEYVMYYCTMVKGYTYYKYSQQCHPGSSSEFLT